MNELFSKIEIRQPLELNPFSLKMQLNSIKFHNLFSDAKMHQHSE